LQRDDGERVGTYSCARPGNGVGARGLRGFRRGIHTGARYVHRVRVRALHTIRSRHWRGRARRRRFPRHWYRSRRALSGHREAGDRIAARISIRDRLRHRCGPSISRFRRPRITRVFARHEHAPRQREQAHRVPTPHAAPTSSSLDARIVSGSTPIDRSHATYAPGAISDGLISLRPPQNTFV